MSDVDDILAGSALFAGLDPDAVDALAPQLERSHATRGSVLFTEGELGNSLLVILSGRVKIGRRSSDGRENMLALLGPGELCGELSLFDPGPRTASAVALTDCEVARFGHDSLRPWITAHPEVGERLLQVLARRLRRTNDAMADLVFTDVPGRVAKALTDLGTRFGSEESDGLRVQHGLTQEELAQLVGASRETVNKALADFASRGWLRLEARTVVLLDRERLSRRAR